MFVCIYYLIYTNVHAYAFTHWMLTLIKNLNDGILLTVLCRENIVDSKSYK